MSRQSQSLRTIQLLVLALVAGVVAFAVVVAALPAQASPPPAAPPAGAQPGGPMLIAVVLVFAGTLTMLPLIGRVLTQTARRRWEESPRDDEAREAVAGRFVVAAIVRAALAEGPGLLSVVVAMITSDLRLLAGAALAVGIMLATFPTRGRWREFHRQVTGEETPTPDHFAGPSTDPATRPNRGL